MQSRIDERFTFTHLEVVPGRRSKMYPVIGDPPSDTGADHWTAQLSLKISVIRGVPGCPGTSVEDNAIS